MSPPIPGIRSVVVEVGGNLEFVGIKKSLAAPQGFEPRYSAPEADVLPLNEGAVPVRDREIGRHTNFIGESA